MSVDPQVDLPVEFVDHDPDTPGSGTPFSAASMNPNFSELATAFNSHTHSEYETPADAQAKADAARGTAESYADAAVSVEATARAAADALLVPLTQKGAANGVASLGSDGLVPAAQLGGSVPYLDVTSAAYGAVGDGINYADGAIASGSAVLTSASGQFTADMVGKGAWVVGAGAAGAVLATTVASYQSATQVTLAAANASGADVSAAKFQVGTDNTTAIQAALDAAYGKNSSSKAVWIPPSPVTGGGATGLYLFKQLKLSNGSILEGVSGFGTRLTRISSATGAAIVEKSTTGAQGITIRNLYVDCNGVTGNGIDLGNQGGADWGFMGDLDSVHVRNAVGNNFNLNADGVIGRNLSAYFGTNNFVTTGHGNNSWHGLFTSRATTAEVDLTGTADSFFGLHVEPNGITSAIIMRSGGSTFIGTTCFLFGNCTNLFEIVGGIEHPTLVKAQVTQGTSKVLTNWITSDATAAISVANATSTGNQYLEFWTPTDGGVYFADRAHGAITQIAPYGIFQANAFAGRIRTVTATGAMTNTDGTVLLNGASVTLTLLAASASNVFGGNQGRRVYVRNIHASASATIASAGGNVDGASTQTLAAGASAIYQSDGTNWWKIG